MCPVLCCCRFRGRGIVMTASGSISGQAVGAYVTAYILRRVLRCALPIEIFFVGQQEAFAPELQAKLRQLGNVRVSDWRWAGRGRCMATSRGVFGRVWVGMPN